MLRLQRRLVHVDLVILMMKLTLLPPLQIREKERKAMEEQDPAISQAKRRREMIVGLPKLFNRIHLLFHSINHSVMTKEELLHKLLTSQTDILDRSKLYSFPHSTLLGLCPSFKLNPLVCCLQERLKNILNYYKN